MMRVFEGNTIEKDVRIICGGRALERVDTSEFWGTIISCNRKAGQEILNRTKKAM